MQQSLKTIWEETYWLLNTIVYGEEYRSRWFNLPPIMDVSRYVEAPFHLYLAINNARVILPDSILKELETHTSKLKESLQKLTKEDAPYTDAQEVLGEYQKICCVLEELGIFLAEKILVPALRAHYPTC